MHNEADTIISTRYCSYNLHFTKNRRRSEPERQKGNAGKRQQTRDPGQTSDHERRASEVAIHDEYTHPPSRQQVRVIGRMESDSRGAAHPRPCPRGRRGDPDPSTMRQDPDEAVVVQIIYKGWDILRGSQAVH